jgi:hypothetical protein
MIEFVAGQVGVPAADIGFYDWDGRQVKRHRAEIRPGDRIPGVQRRRRREPDGVAGRARVLQGTARRPGPRGTARAVPGGEDRAAGRDPDRPDHRLGAAAGADDTLTARRRAQARATRTRSLRRWHTQRGAPPGPRRRSVAPVPGSLALSRDGPTARGGSAPASGQSSGPCAPGAAATGRPGASRVVSCWCSVQRRGAQSRHLALEATRITSRSASARSARARRSAAGPSTRR